MPAFVGSYWFLFTASAVSVLLSVAGLLLVRRFVPHEDLVSHHDVAGAFLSIVGTLYAVVLGFIVVEALNTFNQARHTVEMEANALHDMFHMAKGLPAPLNNKVRNLCLRYADCMIHTEWATMENGLPSEEGHRLTAGLWDLISEYQPQTGGQQDVHQLMMGQMTELGNARHTRLVTSAPSYDHVIWTVLLLGAVVTVVFTYFFGIERLSTQILMTALVTIVLSLNLVLVALFGYPFAGDVKVPPDAFLRDEIMFQQELNEKP